jgi:peptide/nickel transport system ATP-binding protein
MGAMPASGARGERLATIAGRVPTPSEMPAGCRFAGRCPFVVPACRAERPAGRVLAPGQVMPDQVMPDHVTPDHVAACIRAPLEAHVTALA